MELAKLSTSVAEVTSAQSTSLETINTAIGEMEHATQQNAALVEEAAAAVESLDHQAKSLVDAVGLFKLPGTLALAAF